jgi:hypothetical protein
MQSMCPASTLLALLLAAAYGGFAATATPGVNRISHFAQAAAIAPSRAGRNASATQ